MKKIVYFLLFLILIISGYFIFDKLTYKNTIGIIGAMDIEIKEILTNLSNPKTIKHDGFEITVGRFGRNKIILSKCGIGKVNSAVTTQYIIDKYKPDYIINKGLAGSLTDKLKLGDIIIGEKMIQHDFDLTAFGKVKGDMQNNSKKNSPTFYYSDKDLVNKFLKFPDVKTGTILTGDVFVIDTKQKEKLQKEFNADAIDMESAAIAQTAQRNNIPVLVLRTISDTNKDSTDKYTKNKLSLTQESANYIFSMLKD